MQNQIGSTLCQLYSPPPLYYKHPPRGAVYRDIRLVEHWGETACPEEARERISKYLAIIWCSRGPHARTSSLLSRHGIRDVRCGIPVYVGTRPSGWDGPPRSQRPAFDAQAKINHSPKRIPLADANNLPRHFRVYW